MVLVQLLSTEGHWQPMETDPILNCDDLSELIEAPEFYMGILASDKKSQRTLGIFMHAYNDMRTGDAPLVNQCILRTHTGAVVYGHVVLYLCEPTEDGDDEQMLDLKLSQEEITFLMHCVELQDGLLTPHIKCEVLDQPEKRAQLESILKTVDIIHYE